MESEEIENIFWGKIDALLSNYQKLQVFWLLQKYKTIFLGKKGTTHLLEHKIENSKVIFSKPRRHSLAEQEQAVKLCEEMKQAGVIRESSSPYNSSIVMVTQKDGTTRFCIDFRKLNKDTKICKHPLTNPQSCFDKLHNAYFFTSLDLKAAYWSIPMAEEDKEKTAFTV